MKVNNAIIIINVTNCRMWNDDKKKDDSKTSKKMMVLKQN